MDLTIVQYGHSHCSGCIAMHNVLNNNDFAANIVIKDVMEDDEAFAEASKLKIKNLPTTILFHNDKEIYRWIKPTTVEDINNKINEYNENGQISV